MDAGWTSGLRAKSIQEERGRQMNIQGFTPSVAAPQIAQNASAPRATTNSSSSSSSSSLGTSASDLQTTFLNLLVTELQNQDPTAPVDPTAMVGQMVSLNQLDQLMSINQTLDNMSAATTSPTTSSSATAHAVTSLDSGSTDTSSASPANAHLAGTTAASQQLPAYTPMSDPNALMNLYGSFGTPAANSSSTITGGR
jgi:flagellar basal-body rod modification protein FlgD